MKCFAIRRQYAALMTIILLAACGAPAVDSGTTSSSASPADIAPQTNTTTSQSSTERVVKHAMGETRVPANPQRVVVLDTGELDSAVALGIKPVGAVTALPGSGYPAYLEGKTDGITNVGTIAEPNLETILTLKPDLILSSKMRHEDIYDQLSKIAPTVFSERVGVTWKDNLKLHAEALGKSAEAEQLLREYDQRLAEFRTKMGSKLSETEVSIVRFLPSQIRLYQKGSFIGTILEDAGLARPASQRVEDETWLETSKERIADMDGDVMFVTTYGPANKTALETLKADPLWSQLKVVQAGNVHDVSDDHWMLGIGIAAANRVIDDLFTYLAP